MQQFAVCSSQVPGAGAPQQAAAQQRAPMARESTRPHFGCGFVCSSAVRAAGTGTAAAPGLCSPQHPSAAPPAGEATQHGYGVPLLDPRACTVPSGLRHPQKTPLLCVLSQSTVTPRCESTLVLQSLPRGGFQPEFKDGCLGRQLGRVWKSSTLPGHGWGCPDPTGSQQGRAPPGHRHCPAAGAMEITRRQPRARKE